MKPAKTEKLIQSYLSKWVARLALQEWKLTVLFHEHGFPNDGRVDPHVEACVNVNWDYLSARIQFDLSLCSTFDKAELEDVVLHELMHIIVAELRPGDQTGEERTVTRLTRALLANV